MSWFRSMLSNRPTPRIAPQRWRPTLEVLEDRLQPSTSPISLGTAAGFTVLGINGGQVSLVAANLTGNIGIGAHETANVLLTNDTGQLIHDPTAHDHLVPHEDAKISGGIVAQSLTQAALDANAASAAFAALSPTLSYGHVTGSLTLPGDGGTNVISLTSLDYTKGQTLTLSGGANEVFILNVSGAFQITKGQIQLSGGVTANHVLFNFAGKGPAVDLSGAHSVFNGTFLAPNRTVDFVGNGSFNGSILAKNVDVVGGKLSGVTFCPPAPPAQATLSGQVDTPAGAALVNISLTLTNTSTGASYHATTGTDGTFSFCAIPAGTYNLVLGAGQLAMALSSTVGTDMGNPDGMKMSATEIDAITLGGGDSATGYNFVGVQTISA